MKELNVDKNRDIAWAGLEGNDITEEEWNEMRQIAELSNGLVPLEEAAMELTASGDRESAIEYVFGENMKMTSKSSITKPMLQSAKSRTGSHPRKISWS